MSGKLYVVGVGPGDPELLTLKGLRVLREVPCIFVPKGREEGSSLALSIASKITDLSGKEIIEAYFPMRKTRGPSGRRCDLDTKWHETVEAVLSRLSAGVDAAFITMGDPTVYSTFCYLHERLLDLAPDIMIEIVPGVSSITASAARAGIYLGIADERIAVLPANYTNNLKEAMLQFDAVVLMKVHKVFISILRTLEDMQLTDKAVYVSRAGMEDERIIPNIREVKEEDLNYFSVVIVRK
jgi:precorrin-2/cobalt-factor-2 C20-methyltransferase